MKKNKLLIFLLISGGLGYSAYHFNIINKYRNLLSYKDNTLKDSSAVVEKEPFKKTEKGKSKKKRPQKNNPYYVLEKYAFNTPKDKSKTIGQLANYLSQGTSNEYEKARIAFAWIAKNVNYDDYGYNTGDYGDLSAEGVLKSRKAVCEGFSNLYKALCDSMGLNTIKIVGYAKGYGYNIGDKLTETDHAWNAVKIDGIWKLVDVTWGEGYGNNVNGKLKSIKEYDPYWFATDPYEFLFKHLPENNKDQFVNKPISKEQYEHLAYVNNELFELGASAKFILEKSLADQNFNVPEAWSRDYEINVLETELNQFLNSSKEYAFKIKCKENIDIAFVNEDNWTYFKKENDYYIGSITPINGELTVNAKLKGFENSYWPILKYKVK